MGWSRSIPDNLCISVSSFGGKEGWKAWNCPDSYVFSNQIYAYFLCRAVKFSAKLFSKALAKRQKAVILYATETGKSERYAKMLGELFSHAFDPKVRNVWLWDYVTLQISDQRIISPYIITPWINHEGHENIGNYHRLNKILIVNQILPVSSSRNVHGKVLRIFILMLGNKG